MENEDYMAGSNENDDQRNVIQRNKMQSNVIQRNKMQSNVIQRNKIHTSVMHRRGRGGKRITPDTILERITGVSSLRIAAVLLLTGVFLSALYALMWYNYITNWQSGDEINWFHRNGDVLILIMTLGVALIAGYTATSISYRPRFTVVRGEEGNDGNDDGEDEGDVEKRPLEFPDDGTEGILSRFCQLAVPVFALLMLLFLFYVIVGFYKGREDFNVFESNKTFYLSGILHSLIFPLLPPTLLLLFLSGPRGLKRLDLYSSFLLIAGICMVLSVVFSLYLNTELFLFYRDIAQGNWSDAEMSEFAMNYAGDISRLFELGVFCVAALIMSNMKFRSSSRIRFDPTPGMILFLAGSLVTLAAVMISLTVFNPDFDYSGNLDGWGGWSYFLNAVGRVILYGALLLLMVEYSLSRKIDEDDLARDPSDLWDEIREQNPLIGSLMP